MTANTTALLNRHDTFFGVCEGIGQDLGFHPNFLRAILAVSLLFSPALVLSVYAALGVVVFATRWFFPAGKAKAAATQLQLKNDAAAAANDAGAADLAKAA